MLHGHNYQVQLDIFGRPSPALQAKGYLIDFADLKAELKKMVDRWDEHILLPKNHPEIKTQELPDKQALEVRFRERYYVFPKNEVVLLPITNTSVELLAELLSAQLEPFFKSFDLSHYVLRVEETPGQGASYTRYLSNS